MWAIVKPVNERLYLSKVDKQEVYVDCQDVMQHQLDGIRFLYKSFIKSLPGVVLNDPSGYGKTLQIVLFIKSIHHLLEKPVVILSNECDIGNWREHFEKLTDLADDIIIESTNPFRKKMIFINTLNTSQTICRGNWSIMVIDNEEVVPSMFKKLKTDYYRIWVTSMDMKDNLTVFWPIYNWLYPNENLSIEEFTITKNDTPKSVRCKSIKLDRLLEDIIIRRNDWKGPLFPKSQVCQQKPIETVPTATKKNKDSTGTKIKRSKRKLDDNPSTSNEQYDEIKVSKTFVPVVMKNMENENTTINDSSTKMHLFECFDNTHITLPSKKKDLSFALNPNTNKNKVIHNNSENEGMKVVENESMSINGEILVSNKLVAKDVIKEINGMDVDGAEEISVSNINENVTNKNEISNDLDAYVDSKNDNVNIFNKNELSRDVAQIDSMSIGDDNLICSTSINDTTKDEKEENKIIETSVSDTDGNNMCNKIEVFCNVDHKNSKVKNEVIRFDDKQNESMYGVVCHSSVVEMTNDVEVNGIEEPFVSVTKENNSCKNNVSNVNNDMNKEVNGIPDVKVVGKNIDDQIRDLEEKYMKKFKGSFLDSLFK